MTISNKLPRILKIIISICFSAALFIACSSAEQTNMSTPAPAAAPDVTVTTTSEQSEVTPSPEAKMGEPFLLPTATPAPTLTPDLFTDLVNQFAQTTGLQGTTIFRVSVENWLDLGLSILLTLIIGFLLSRLVYYLLTKAAERTETKYDDIFFARIRSQILLVIITFGVQIGTVRLSLLESLIKLRVSRLYNAIYVFAATVILWRLVDVLVEWYQHEVEPKKADPHQVDTMLILLHRIARALLLMISLMMVLSLYNINVNALIAALGVGSLAISLAAQDTLSNVISGIMIMMDQPFRVGDRIEIQRLGTWGDVVDIGLRSTRIRTSDNRLVIIPNNVISTDQIVNYTFPDPRYRIQVELGIGYEDEIEKVRQIIIATVRQVEGVLPDKPVDALIVNMGEYAMTVRVRWWIVSYRDTNWMFDQVYSALLRTLDEAGIKIPSGTYDVKLLNMYGVEIGKHGEE